MSVMNLSIRFVISLGFAKTKACVEGGFNNRETKWSVVWLQDEDSGGLIANDFFSGAILWLSIKFSLTDWNCSPEVILDLTRYFPSLFWPKFYPLLKGDASR